MDLKELFDNNADCYTDVQKYDWTEEQAMTRDKFEEVVKKLILSSVGSRRELLNSFLIWQDQDNEMEHDAEWTKEYLDRYLETI